MIKTIIKKYPLLVIIVVLAFIIRLVAGYVQSFSNDELSALYRLQFSKFSDLMHWGIKVDGHPALVQLFLYAYTSIVPKGEIFVRLPFILASTVSLVFVFLSLKKLAGEFTAYMVVIILAFAGFSIQLGYFARPYAFGMLFTSAATYYWIRIFIEQSKSKKYLVLFIVFSILAAYTHYFALLEIVMLGMATFLFAPIKLWWKMMVAGIITVLAFLPHYPITAFQMSVGGIGGWLGKPKDYFIVNLLFEFFDRSAMIVGMVVLVLLVMIIRHAAKPQIKTTLLMTFLSIFPFCILYFYSIKVNSVLQFSACFFLIPFLLGAFFSMFETGEERSTFVRIGYVAVILIFLTSTLYSNNAFAPTHFAEFKRIAEYIEEHESDSVTTVVAVNNPFYIDYYLKDKKPDLYITDMGDNLSFLKRYIDTCKTSEFIYAFANERSNIELPFIVNQRFSFWVNSEQYMNSESYHFSRSKKVSKDEFPFSKMEEYVLSPQKDTFGKMSNDFQDSTYMLFSGIEYSPTFKIKLSDLNVNSYDRVLVSAFFSETDHCDLEIVLSVEDEKEAVFWRSRKLTQQFGKYDYHQLDSIVKYSGKYDGPKRFLAIGETLQDEKIDLKEHFLKAYIWNPNHCGCYVSRFIIGIYRGNDLVTGYSQ